PDTLGIGQKRRLVDVEEVVALGGLRLPVAAAGCGGRGFPHGAFPPVFRASPASPANVAQVATRVLSDGCGGGEGHSRRPKSPSSDARAQDAAPIPCVVHLAGWARLPASGRLHSHASRSSNAPTRRGTMRRSVLARNNARSPIPRAAASRLMSRWFTGPPARSSRSRSIARAWTVPIRGTLDGARAVSASTP